MLTLSVFWDLATAWYFVGLIGVYLAWVADGNIWPNKPFEWLPKCPSPFGMFLWFLLSMGGLIAFMIGGLVFLVQVKDRIPFLQRFADWWTTPICGED